MELLIVIVPAVVFLVWACYSFGYVSREEKEAEADYLAWYKRRCVAELEHGDKPAICLNCQHYNQASRACHRMPQPTRKPADHWCGEFNRITFVFKEEA